MEGEKDGLGRGRRSWVWEGGREATGQQVGHLGDPYRKAIQLSLRMY